MKNFLYAFCFAVLLCGLCQPAAHAAPVRMGYLQNDLHHLPLWVAQDKGFFAVQGVDAAIAGVFRAGPEIMTAFASGALDMAYVGEAPATIAFARGAKVRLLAQVNAEGSALVVAANSPAASTADLKGKKIAVPGNGTVQDFLARRALKQAGVNPADARFIIISPPEMGNALQDGQIDAFVAWQPYPARAVTSGIGRMLEDSAVIWEGHPCCALMVREDLARSEQAVNVIKAHKQAIDFIRAHPDEATRIAMRHTGMDEATVREALAHVTYIAQPSVEGEKEYVQFLSTFGYIPKRDADAFARAFIDEYALNASEQ